MKKNNIVLGVALIAVAVLMIASGMGLLSGIPWLQAIVSVCMLVFSVQQICGRQFFWAMISLGCIGWIWEDYIGIDEIAPFPLLFAAALAGIGLNMIFGEKQRVITSPRDGEKGNMDGVGTQKWQDGRHVTFENIFSNTSKYVNSEAFATADFSNVFGSANIYFNNAVIAGGEAKIKVENVFGRLNLYFPATWRMQINKESVFGGVRIYGTPCTDPDAPLIYINTESVFGGVNIYFE